MSSPSNRPAEHPSPSPATETRFGFGDNWRRFLTGLDQSRVEAATSELASKLEFRDLKERSFLDAGSGSGLASLAAHRLGAKSIHSFDYDPASVACTAELRRRFGPHGSDRWQVERGDVLDARYLESLGLFDVVYSWGVLHHTGDMWAALDAIEQRVDTGGVLFIALYNDQGWISDYWRTVKRMYASTPVTRPFLIAFHAPYLVGVRWLVRRLKGRRLDLNRGMSVWVDLKDWLGGYPFEVARPDEVIARLIGLGYELKSSTDVGRRHGCNEFVCVKS